MKFSLGLLTLAATTSSVVAVNLALFTNNGCSGGSYAQCTNLGSNVCCVTLIGAGATAGAESELFTGLPNPSRVNGWQQTRDGNKCGSLRVSGGTQGGAACVIGNRNTFGTFSGGSFQAGVRKVRRGAAIPDVGRCSKTVEADTFVTESGDQYDLTKMPRDVKLQFFDLSRSANLRTASDTFAAYKKGTKAAALPAEFQSLSE